MVKRKENKLFLIIGLLLIIMGIGTLIYNYNDNIKIKIQNKKAIKEYYKKEKQDEETNNDLKPDQKITYRYVAILKIPKINLENGIVEKNSIYNNVQYGIEMLEESDYPDKINGDFILASHNGNSPVSHFRNLYRLELGDEAIVDYKNSSYIYKLTNIYDIPKTGKATIKSNNKKNNLVLITCKGNTDFQTVYIFENN